MVLPGMYDIVQWYGLVGMVWFMSWPGGHSMRYGLAGITWYILWPGGCGVHKAIIIGATSYIIIL